MVARLNTISVPTRDSPRWVRRQDVPSIQQSVEQEVYRAVLAVRKNLVGALKADRDAQDGREHYRMVYDQCKPDEWATAH
jgi:hypothetical protein